MRTVLLFAIALGVLACRHADDTRPSAPEGVAEPSSLAPPDPKFKPVGLEWWCMESELTCTRSEGRCRASARDAEKDGKPAPPCERLETVWCAVAVTQDERYFVTCKKDRKACELYHDYLRQRTDEYSSCSDCAEW